MKKRKIFLSIILGTILLFSNIVLAKNSLPDASNSFYIYDEANIIDKEVENYIVKTNEVLYKKTGAQVVIATVENLNDLDVREYANLLFEKWGIGSSEYDNGVLILVSPKDRELWIEIGYGLEGVLPDGKVGRIRDEQIFPYFKEGNYSEGVLRGFNSILNAIEEEYNVDLEREEISESYYYDYNEEDEGSGEIGIFNTLTKILIIIGIIIFLFIDFRFFNGWLTYSILRGARFSGGFNDDNNNKGGGGSSGGGGAGGKW